MPDSAMDDKIIEGVAIGNLKSISEQPAMLSNLGYSNIVANTNLSMQNAVSNQQTLNETGVAVLGKAVNQVSNLGPLESKSASEVLTGNTVAEQLSALKATVQAFANNGGKINPKPQPHHSDKDNPFKIQAPAYLEVMNVVGPDNITVKPQAEVKPGEHPILQITKK